MNDMSDTIYVQFTLRANNITEAENFNVEFKKWAEEKKIPASATALSEHNIPIDEFLERSSTMDSYYETQMGEAYYLVGNKITDGVNLSLFSATVTERILPCKLNERQS